MLARILLGMNENKIREWLDNKVPGDVHRELIGYTIKRRQLIKRIPYRELELMGIEAEWAAVFVHGGGIRTNIYWNKEQGWKVSRTTPLEAQKANG